MRGGGPSLGKETKMAFNAKYAGSCKRCDDAIEVGERIESNRAGRGYRHVGCSAAGEVVESPEKRRMNAEYAAGVADYERWKFNSSMFGDEFACAEEIAHDMKYGW
jgi:hypothetical protein